MGSEPTRSRNASSVDSADRLGRDAPQEPFEHAGVRLESGSGNTVRSDPLPRHAGARQGGIRSSPRA